MEDGTACSFRTAPSDARQGESWRSADGRSHSNRSQSPITNNLTTKGFGRASSRTYESRCWYDHHFRRPRRRQADYLLPKLARWLLPWRPSLCGGYAIRAVLPLCAWQPHGWLCVRQHFHFPDGDRGEPWKTTLAPSWTRSTGHTPAPTAPGADKFTALVRRCV